MGKSRKQQNKKQKNSGNRSATQEKLVEQSIKDGQAKEWAIARAERRQRKRQPAPIIPDTSSDEISVAPEPVVAPKRKEGASPTPIVSPAEPAASSTPESDDDESSGTSDDEAIKKLKKSMAFKATAAQKIKSSKTFSCRMRALRDNYIVNYTGFARLDFTFLLIAITFLMTLLLLSSLGEKCYITYFINLPFYGKYVWSTKEIMSNEIYYSLNTPIGELGRGFIDYLFRGEPFSFTPLWSEQVCYRSFVFKPSYTIYGLISSSFFIRQFLINLIQHLNNDLFPGTHVVSVSQVDCKFHTNFTLPELAEDVRTDYASSSKLKHNDPQVVGCTFTIKHAVRRSKYNPWSVYDDKLGYYVIWTTERKYTKDISIELISQLLAQNVKSLGSDEELIQERLNSGNLKICSVNIDRFDFIGSECINFHSLFAAKVLALEELQHLNL